MKTPPPVKESGAFRAVFPAVSPHGCGISPLPRATTQRVICFRRWDRR